MSGGRIDERRQSDHAGRRNSPRAPRRRCCSRSARAGMVRRPPARRRIPHRAHGDLPDADTRAGLRTTRPGHRRPDSVGPARRGHRPTAGACHRNRSHTGSVHRHSSGRGRRVLSVGCRPYRGDRPAVRTVRCHVPRRSRWQRPDCTGGTAVLGRICGRDRNTATGVGSTRRHVDRRGHERRRVRGDRRGCAGRNPYRSARTGRARAAHSRSGTPRRRRAVGARRCRRARSVRASSTGSGVRAGGSEQPSQPPRRRPHLQRRIRYICAATWTNRSRGGCGWSSGPLRHLMSSCCSSCTQPFS